MWVKRVLEVKRGVEEAVMSDIGRNTSSPNEHGEPSSAAYPVDTRRCLAKHFPRAPLLSSHSVEWQGITLEYHRQPAHETSKH